MHIAEGQDALLKLSKPLVNQASCLITDVHGVSFNINSPPSDRYERWGGDHCGVRIKNITKSDEGRWRMTAAREDTSIIGFSEVHVIDSMPSYTVEPIVLDVGEHNVQVDLSPIDNAYCFVTQPFSEGSLVPGHCTVTLERATKAVQGSWGVGLGIPGRVQEYSLPRHVAIEAEHLDVGFIHDSQENKIHIYCNVLNTHADLSFCRFQRTSGSTAFNVMDGLSDGHHSYYGDGFLKKQCGLTIEQPTSEDFGTWRCSVGLQVLVGTVVTQRSPMQALISVTPQPENRRVITDTDNEGNDIVSVFVQNDKQMTINCMAEVSLRYCWFHGPNGLVYSPVQLQEEEQTFWYTGEGLSLGECGITFVSALDEFDGVWTCHMGPENQMGVEFTDRVEVRVTGPLAANVKEVEALIRGSATLFCHSSNGNQPLEYCRFVTPHHVGINVDSTVTSEQALLGRYYFTPNRSLNYGDCSLTINPVSSEDMGLWTCAALVFGETVESQDTIVLSQGSGGSGGLSRAGIAGMIIGLSVLALVLVATFLYKRVRLPFLPERNRNASSQIGMVDMTSRNSATSSGTSSTSSEEQIDIGRRPR